MWVWQVNKSGGPPDVNSFYSILVIGFIQWPIRKEKRQVKNGLRHYQGGQAGFKLASHTNQVLFKILSFIYKLSLLLQIINYKVQ